MAPKKIYKLYNRAREEFIAKYSKIVFAVMLSFSSPSFAFSDGSGWVQVSYLIKLVAESIRRYQQLQMMIQYSKDAQSYMREINRGLDASIRLLESLPIKDEKILGDLRTFQKSLKEIEKIYGVIPKSPDEAFEKFWKVVDGLKKET